MRGRLPRRPHHGAHEDYTEQHQDVRTEDVIDYGDGIEEVNFGAWHR